MIMTAQLSDLRSKREAEGQADAERRKSSQPREFVDILSKFFDCGTDGLQQGIDCVSACNFGSDANPMTICRI
jgi:hypothetical protein